MINSFLEYPRSCRLIVNRGNDNSWCASIAGVPTTLATAQYPLSAAQRLIDRAGDPMLKLESLQPVTHEIMPGQLVFEIPPTDWRPRQLMN